MTGPSLGVDDAPAHPAPLHPVQFSPAPLLWEGWCPESPAESSMDLGCRSQASRPAPGLLGGREILLGKSKPGGAAGPTPLRGLRPCRLGLHLADTQVLRPPRDGHACGNSHPPEVLGPEGCVPDMAWVQALGVPPPSGYGHISASTPTKAEVRRCRTGPHSLVRGRSVAWAAHTQGLSQCCPVAAQLVGCCQAAPVQTCECCAHQKGRFYIQ